MSLGSYKKDFCVNTMEDIASNEASSEIPRSLCFWSFFVYSDPFLRRFFFGPKIEIIDSMDPCFSSADRNEPTCTRGAKFGLAMVNLVPRWLAVRLLLSDRVLFFNF
eukprot:SAG11_NODE_65_length_18798_cov_11.881224_5_plen_107_part_00